MTVILNETFNGVQRGYNKTVNNVKCGLGLAATAGAYLAIDRDCYVAKQAGKAVTFVGKKIGNSIAKTTVGGYLVSAKKSIANFTRPVRKVIGDSCKAIKNTSVVKSITKSISKNLAKIPYKPIAAVAALITAAVIINNRAYKSGKIDQRYNDKQAITNAYNLPF